MRNRLTRRHDDPPSLKLRRGKHGDTVKGRGSVGAREQGSMGERARGEKIGI